MSEPFLGTRSKTWMHLKKFKTFVSLRRPETHFRHAQGHLWANELTGSINIIHNTIITVYEVEHQKTVNTELGEQTIWFPRCNQRHLTSLPRKTGWKTKKTKIKLHCFPKAYQSILQNHMAKKCKHFWKTDQNTPQTKHRKKLMSSKTNNNWAILADFSPYRYEVNERSHFWTKKLQNRSIRGLIAPGIQLQTFPSKYNTRNFNLKPETQLRKNSFQN